VSSSTLAYFFPESNIDRASSTEVITDMDYRDAYHVHMARVGWTEDDLQNYKLLPVDDRRCMQILALRASYAAELAEMERSLGDPKHVITVRLSDEEKASGQLVQSLPCARGLGGFEAAEASRDAWEPRRKRHSRNEDDDDDGGFSFPPLPKRRTSSSSSSNEPSDFSFVNELQRAIGRKRRL
jgi:hypothetical protein